MGGGRSDRYDEKHAARGGGRTYLPSWSDAAAAAVMEQLKLDALAKTGQQKVKKADVAEMLAAPGGGESLATRAGKKLTPADRGLVHAIVTAVQQEVQQAVQDGGNDKALSRVHSFLKPLRERKAARGEVGELVVPAAESGPVTFHVWLAEDPITEHLLAIKFQAIRTRVLYDRDDKSKVIRNEKINVMGCVFMHPCGEEVTVLAG